jgi:hypothetical protein
LITGTVVETTVFVIHSYKVCVTNFMNIHSTFLYLGLSMASVSPTLSHAQVSLPAWLHPTWIKAKLSDSPVKKSDSYEMTQANVVTNNGTTNLQMNPQSNQQISQSQTQTQIKQPVNLAPVETAVPKLNEKHLTAEELKELRRQLRQQR